MSYARNEFKQDARSGLWLWALALLVIALIYLLIVVATPLTIGLGWATGEANLHSFGSYRQTYALAFDDVKALDALTTQTCRFQAQAAAATKAGDSTLASQRQTQADAVANRYDSLRGEYDAYMSDHFRGGVNHPSLPLPYPTLPARQRALC